MRLSDAIETILQAVRAVNRYLDAQAPWNLHKQQQGERLAAVLAASARAAAQAAGLLWPAMPAKCDEALACFGLDPASLSETDRWNVDAPKPGAAVAESASLFPRVDAKTIEKPAGKASAPAAPAKEKSKPVEEKGLIQYDDFAKLDLRVATILEAEKHPEADRLLRLRVDIGQETRQIVAGIAEHFDPASLIGRQIVVVANLAPRKLRGLESQGMLLAAHDSRGLRLIAPSADTEPGASVS
ncbi:MAG: Methionine--tRNA ligase [candidate division BRC1 bacterium ADurb.BinA364]|nr:MAG: Methionine--tRNA ligase [candidate division BRC1 bacterium ADurb.BinA364]